MHYSRSSLSPNKNPHFTSCQNTSFSQTWSQDRSTIYLYITSTTCNEDITVSMPAVSSLPAKNSASEKGGLEWGLDDKQNESLTVEGKLAVRAVVHGYHNIRSSAARLRLLVLHFFQFLFEEFMFNFVVCKRLCSNEVVCWSWIARFWGLRRQFAGFYTHDRIGEFFKKRRTLAVVCFAVSASQPRVRREQRPCTNSSTNPRKFQTSCTQRIQIFEQLIILTFFLLGLNDFNDNNKEKPAVEESVPGLGQWRGLALHRRKCVCVFMPVNSVCVQLTARPRTVCRHTNACTLLRWCKMVELITLSC